jgi:hypothetical protein
MYWGRCVFNALLLYYNVYGKTHSILKCVLNPLIFYKVIARPECRWVSVSDGNNAYGSEVVERVLSAPRLAVPILGSDRRSRGRHSRGGRAGGVFRRTWY